MRFTFLQGLLYFFNLAMAALLVYDLGVPPRSQVEAMIDAAYLLLAAGSLVLTVLRKKREDRTAIVILSILIVGCSFAALRNVFPSFAPFVPQVEQGYLVLVFIYLVYGFSRATKLLYSGSVNAMLLFAGSFAIIILAGSFLLTLPLATTNGISYIDALFTATSAVSVTGLAVLNTGVDFTLFGQSVILLLIQLGGLGILTFTSFFAYFFQSGSSFKEGMYLQDMISSDSLGDVWGLILRIVGFTLSFELAGAVLIFWTVQPVAGDMNVWEQLFFSIFHSVSAFCNAGFSTLGNSLYEGAFRFNYGMHWVVAILLIFGGLGFKIIFNAFKFVQTYLRRRLISLFNSKPFVMPVRLVTMDARIVLTTTGLLIGIGTIFFYIAEYNYTLAEHSSFFGKFTTAFFGAVTPRTAGFNSVDMAALSMPAVLLTLLLMWIGASPGSTGGGIKTSTFALATLNILAIARGKRRIEVASRQISSLAVNRAFAIISLSLIILGISVFFVMLFDPHLGLLNVAFECFSAYSTVGLSLGITASLSTPSKIVILLTMFVGRIGAINILVGMMRQMNREYYHFPKENIVIN